jgi:hypothetical protein
MSYFKLPETVHGSTTLVLTSSEHMLLVGGEHRGNFEGSVQIYNLASQDFSGGKSMEVPRVNFGAIYFDGKVYCVGGWSNSFVKRCDAYDIAQNRWYPMPDLNQEREGISLCVVADEWLFAFGSVATRGQRFKCNKGVWTYSYERIRLCETFSRDAKWEVVEIKGEIKGEQPSFKHMGCFCHYSNRDLVLIFGGGANGQI